MDQLLQFDHQLFHFIHHGLEHPWLDAIMPYWREKTTWTPLYLLLIFLLTRRFRWPALYYLLVLGVTVGIADFTSSELIKKSVQRPRPCREVSLSPPADPLIGCGGGYSFTSSHATNHFAVAVFLFLGWGRLFKRRRWLFIVWAASIALGQVYVGVHYPLDITAGALVGTLLAVITHAFYRRRSWRIGTFYT